MIKKVIWLLLIAVNCFGQKDSLNDYKNEINLELFGSGIIYSINYERTFHQKNNIEFKGSLGAHFNPFRINIISDDRTIGFNVEPKINWIFNRNSIEIGLAYSYLRLLEITSSGHLDLVIPRCGYRRYNKQKLKYWGISFTPIFILDYKVNGNRVDSASYTPYGSFRYGWRF